MKRLISIFMLACVFSGISAGIGHDLNSECNIISEIDNLSWPDTISRTSLLIRPVNIDIVAPSSGVQFYRDGIIFLSCTKAEESFPEKHLSFGSPKIFRTTINDTLPGECLPFEFSTNKIFPSEATTFTDDFKTMYLSFIPDRKDKEKIFTATDGLTGWVIEDNPLDFCSDDYIYSHPSLSADGTFMIFSSNRPGSYGGLDLFISRKLNEGWSDPQNIGRHINSEGTELFASLDAENNLYFSSDGLPGFGGYDIFVCLYNGTGWDNPANLSGLINSKDDEVAFTFSKNDKRSALFTLRTRSGRNKVQLYSISLNPTALPGQSKELSHLLIARAVMKDRADIFLHAERSDPATTDPAHPELTRPHVTQTAASKSKTGGSSLPDTDEKEIKTSSAGSDSIQLSEEDKGELIYRVQILTKSKPVGSYDITIDKDTYSTYEYFHKGSYRTAIGEFSTLAEAVNFQNTCRRNGFSQAFVSAFAGNKRITDVEARILEAGKSKDDIAPQAQGDKVIYRVQFTANTKPVGSYVVTVAGREYKTFEYLHMGGYRTTIGEFSTLAEAVNLQNTCRRNGFNQAFVVAFKNNIRSNDPALFK